MHTTIRADRRLRNLSGARAELTPELELAASSVIPPRARRLLHLPLFKRHELADVEQELWCAALKAAPRFDRRRASERIFIIVVVDRAAHSLVRMRRAGKRGAPSRCFDLDAIWEEGATPRCSGEPRRSLTDVDRHLDVQRVLATLSDDERALVNHLMHGNISDAARQMGVPRTTANHWVKKIRARFEDAGLREYL